MSSKILRPEGGELERLVWRRVGTAEQQVAPVINPLPASEALAMAEVPKLRARIAELEAQLPQSAEQARAAGREEGERAATERAAREIAAVTARAAQSAEELLLTRREMRRQLEEDLVRLAVAVARRILHRELSVAPEALGGIVRAVLDRLDAREVHAIRVSPADAAPLEKRATEWNLPVRAEIRRDPSLERGAIVVEIARGAVDGSVETQLQEIERGFADLVRRQE